MPRDGSSQILREKTKGNKHVIDSGWKQCDQIGWFLKVIDGKSSPNIWWLIGLFWKTSHLSKTASAALRPTYQYKTWATVYSNIWSHWLEAKKFKNWNFGFRKVTAGSSSLRRDQCDQKKLPKVCRSCPKMILLENDRMWAIWAN